MKLSSQLSCFLVLCLAGCTLQYNSFHAESPGELELSLHGTKPIAGSWSVQLGKVSGSSPVQANFWFSIRMVDPATGEKMFTSRSQHDFPAFTIREKDSTTGVLVARLETEAGVLSLKGNRLDRKASGEFEFAPAPRYLEAITPHFHSPPTALEWLYLGLAQISPAEIAGYNNRPGTPYSVAEIGRLKNQGASPGYVAGLREAQVFSVEEIIRLRNQGVPSDYPRALREAGYELNAEDYSRLRNNGIRADEAVAWRKAGFQLNSEELCRLRNNGIPPTFGAAIRASLPEVKPDQLIRLRNNGISEDYLRQLQGIELQTEEIVLLRNSGVPPDYLQAWRRAGYKFTPQEIIRLRNSGVPVEYAQALNMPNRTPLTAESIIRLRNRGLAAEEIRSLRE